MADSDQLLGRIAWFSRAAIASVYIYFGALKILGISPAEDIVALLHAQTVSFIPIHTFLTLLGIGETIIGLMFLWPKITTIAYVVFLAHMFTTVLPLFILPHETWSRFGVPTLTGQYIMKNVILIALATNIFFIIKINNHQKNGIS
ncbi:MAG: hypothetical protein WC544_00605 [Patescibacteria group bacterium]